MLGAGGFGQLTAGFTDPPRQLRACTWGVATDGHRHECGGAHEELPNTSGGAFACISEELRCLGPGPRARGSVWGLATASSGDAPPPPESPADPHSATHNIHRSAV